MEKCVLIKTKEVLNKYGSKSDLVHHNEIATGLFDIILEIEKWIDLQSQEHSSV